MIKIGDRIEVEGSEVKNYATVKKVDNKIVCVEWDNFPGKTLSYQIEEIVDLWMVKGSYLKASDFGLCDHQWVSYQGFRENYKYCQKCDQKAS